MKTKRIEKGEKASLPCHVLGKKKSGGWICTSSPHDGLIVVLDGQEWNARGCFLSDEILRKNGYIFVGGDLGQGLMDKNTKAGLISMLNVLGKKDSKNVNKNKKVLANEIIAEVLNIQK